MECREINGLAEGEFRLLPAITLRTKAFFWRGASSLLAERPETRQDQPRQSR